MAAGAGRARQHTIYFGEFELDLSGQVLSHGGVRTKLQRQPFQVLELLVQRAPAIVSREEIRRHVWGDDVYVDATQSINFCIRQIRLALGDASTGCRFVETLPRQGYRFIAPVHGLRTNTFVPEPLPIRESAPSLSRRRWPVLVLALLLHLQS
jgi:DNA-binding winged helix-turn-helix (wHTH) protein